MEREKRRTVRPRLSALASLFAVMALLLAPTIGGPALAQEGGAVGVDEVVANAGAYYGNTVTVTGDVANIMDPLEGLFDSLAFTVVGHGQPPAGATGTGVSPNELLIVRAPTALFGGPQLELAPSDRVQATGVVIVFNQDEVERTTGLRLDDQAVQDWSGRPALVAWDINEMPADASAVGPPSRPIDEKEPATVNLVTSFPASYYGRIVSVGGEVVETFDPTGGMLEPVAFSIASDGRLDGTAAQEPLLVIRAPVTAAMGSVGAFAPGDWINVSGPVVMFNVAEIEQATGLDLDNQMLQRWDGRPAVIAWNIRGAS